LGARRRQRLARPCGHGFKSPHSLNSRFLLFFRFLCFCAVHLQTGFDGHLNQSAVTSHTTVQSSSTMTLHSHLGQRQLPTESQNIDVKASFCDSSKPGTQPAPLHGLHLPLPFKSKPDMTAILTETSRPIQVKTLSNRTTLLTGSSKLQPHTLTNS
jgi:hypothetical protein